jgi:hypothetical protein
MVCEYIFRIGANKGKTCGQQEKRGTPGKCWKHQGMARKPVKKEQVETSQQEKEESPKNITQEEVEVETEPIASSTSIVKLDTTAKDSNEIDALLETSSEDEEDDRKPRKKGKRKSQKEEKKDEGKREEKKEGNREQSEVDKKSKFSQAYMLKTGFFCVCTAAELMVKNYGFQEVDGSTFHMMADPEISECLEEIARDMNFDNGEPVDPYTKLMFLMGATIFSTYVKNANAKEKQAKPNGKVYQEDAKPQQYQNQQDIPYQQNERMFVSPPSIPNHVITPTKNPPPKAFVNPQKPIDRSATDDFFKKLKFEPPPVLQADLVDAKNAVIATLNRENFLAN